MDLEEELMDLESNESAYLPHVAHTVAHAPAPVAVAAAAELLPPPVVRSERVSAFLPAPDVPTPSSIPSVLHNPPSRAASTDHRAIDLSSVLAPGAAADALLPDATSRTTEEPAGWYDQIEMLLATAEVKYLEWQEQLDAHGSVDEEAMLAVEQQRVQRRTATVARLKLQRTADVRAVIASAVAHGRSPPSTGLGENSTVDQLFAKLELVVDLSAKGLHDATQNVIWLALVDDLAQHERDYVAKAADEMFLEQMKYKREVDETEALVRQHLRALFRLQPPTKNGQSVVKVMQHSLGLVLREFADIFHACYGGSGLLNTSAAAYVGALLPMVAADVNQFASIMVQVLVYKYPGVLRPWIAVVRRSVIDALFEHLQPTLHGLYVAAFADEDAFVSRLAQQMRTTRLERFGVAPVFRLDGSWRRDHGDLGGSDDTTARDANELQLQSMRQYDALIERMAALPTLRAPWAKTELIATICRDIDVRVKSFYAVKTQVPAPSAAELNVTAADLCALLAFLLVAAPPACTNVATQLALLGSFMESESAAGEAGFAVATLWSAVVHLCHLPRA